MKDNNPTASLKQETGLLRLAVELFLAEDLNSRETKNLKDIRNSAKKITRITDQLLKEIDAG